MARGYLNTTPKQKGKVLSDTSRCLHLGHPKKTRMSKLKVNTMLIMYFDIRETVHHEFVPQPLTPNSIIASGPTSWTFGNFTITKRQLASPSLLSDSWRIKKFQQFASRSTWRPRPKMALLQTYFLFLRLKTSMKGYHFGTVDKSNGLAPRL